ncbi:hypothetical protein HZH68_016503 [Vespula germanica]|uniref:Uncharacterized protein n=1 Tax=Vespula germanica TaxID=30212 RepID=A0A834J1V8_VESGE|nr:hypothetical protein HZH68_016503 [Vespula germanica]
MPADQRATTTLVDAYQPRANDGANFRDAGLLPPSPYPHYPPQPPPSSSPSTTASTDIVATLFTLCPITFYQLNLYAVYRYRDINCSSSRSSSSSNSSSSSSSSSESLPVKAQKLTYYFWSKSAATSRSGGITSGGLSWCGLPKATNLFPGVTPKG